jgi:hypothetical protein
MRMKPTFLFVCLALAGQAHAAPASGEVRQDLQPSRGASPAPTQTKQLSPLERAELRRQLADFSRTPARRP